MGGGFDKKPGGSSLVQGATSIGNPAPPGPGKRTLTEELPHVDPVAHETGATQAAGNTRGALERSEVSVQRKTDTVPQPSARTGIGLFGIRHDAVAVQLRVDDATKTPAATHEAAKLGLEGHSQALPYLDQIQRSFGPHDVSGVRAFVGGPAADASNAMGARAYATGNATAFAATPDLHTAAHEAAHVVQQRAGVQLSGGVGQEGDGYERHADAVADLVVHGRSAATELDRLAPVNGSAASTGRDPASSTPRETRAPADAQGAEVGSALQRAPAEPSAHMPALGGARHKEWPVEEFIAMWEKEHGHKMSDGEKQILAHGCIGITALNLGRGSQNPPLGLSFSTFEQAKHVQTALNNIIKAKPAADKLGDMIAKSPQLFDLKNVLASMPMDPDPTKWHAYVFSKRFFSRQTGSWEQRKSGDPTKFAADKHGQVDMSGDQDTGRADADEGAENYMINFDYGWYDDSSGSWLHANHAEPNMKVYQSTLEYYSRPLRNFDRQVFSVAFARVTK